MRNREDMNKYNTNQSTPPSSRTEGEFSRSLSGTAGSIGSMIWKAVKTVLFIVMLTGILVFISVATYILSFRDEEPPKIELTTLNLTSTVYTMNDTGEFAEYETLHSTEDRILVTYDEIPQHMIDSVVAIEDKRFWDHDGVDWRTTANAVAKLFLGGGDGGSGGSTITQQLIKNITKDNSVSILRKVREIFMALNMEKVYSKQEIMLAYLNIVNFGSDTQGVGAAAKLYFDKSISECDIAECASIAGITRFPYAYTPLIDQEANKKRQQDVLWAMQDQGLITQDEYKVAMEKSENMHFVGWQYDTDSDDDGENDTGGVWNWYMETMFSDLIEEIAEVTGYSREDSAHYIYTGGLQIYSAMDVKLQTGIENLFKNKDILPSDEQVNFGVYVMDYTGKTIGVVGNRREKTGNRWWSNATDTVRQTGSSIKPISVYAPSLEEGVITYGTVLEDKPIPNYFDDGKSGPGNFSGTYRGSMNVDKALEMSQNAPAARLIDKITPQVAFDFLVNKLHFKNLDPARDVARSTMALGGLTNGASVREMTAAFQIFGNAGVYNKPYTYLYVRDHNGDVIIDHRNNENAEQAMSAENATVMYHLLQKPIYGDEGTARGYLGEFPDLFGKTGTTDDMYDLWFVGGSKTFVAGIWNGYADFQSELYDTNTAKVMWRALYEYLMANYNPENSGFKLSENISQCRFCRSSGKLAGGGCFNTDMGYYSNNNIPGVCNGGSDHIAVGASTKPSTNPSTEPSTSPSVAPSIDPSINPSIDPSILPTIDPTDNPSSGTEDPETPGPETPVPPVPETPVPETPVPETPVPETPPPESSLPGGPDDPNINRP